MQRFTSRRFVPKKINYALIEHKDLQNDSIIEFTQKKLTFFLDNLHYYQSEQQNLSPSQIKLLTFAYDQSEEPQVEESKNESKNNNNQNDSEECQNQQGSDCKGKPDQTDNLIDNEEAEEQDQEGQELDEQMDKFYKETLLNLRKDNDLLANKTHKITQRDEYTQWFDKVDEMATGQATYQQEISYNHSQYQKYTQKINDGVVSKIMRINTSLHNINEYYKFEDLFSTSILYFNTPIYLQINCNINSFLSLLTVIKTLLQVNSYSTLKIDFSSFWNYNTDSNEFKLVEKLVETIFRIIFSQRRLQLIEFIIDQRLLKNVAKGMSQTDLENSNVRVFINDQSLPMSSGSDLNDYFYQISKLKKLYHFKTTALITEHNIENFLKILRNVTDADLHIMRTQIKFDFPKLEKLNLKYTFYSSTEVKINYDNFKNAANLSSLQIQHNTMSAQKIYFQPEFTRKFILQNAEFQKNRKNKTSEKQNEQNIQSIKENELYEEFVNGPDETPYTLNALINLKKLLNLKIGLRYDQQMINSLIALLKTSSSIKDISVSFPYGNDSVSFPYGINSLSYPYGINSLQYPYGINSLSYPYGINSLSYPYGINSLSFPYGINRESFPQGIDSVKEDVDLTEILLAINSCKSLDQFSLDFLSVRISFNQHPFTKKYSYSLEYKQQTQNEYKIIFNPYQFAFDDDVTKITLNVDCGEDHFLERLDQICQSVSNTKNVSSLQLNITCDATIYKLLEKNKVNNCSLLLFQHLGNLTYLRELNVLLPLNQEIIDSFVPMFEQQKSLKYFQICRQKVKQYYLDFTKLFKAVSDSSCIEQISLHLSIENMKVISKDYQLVWEEAKLKYFYLQICKMIKNSKSLEFIDFNDEFNEKALILIYKTLLELDCKFFEFVDSNRRFGYNSTVTEEYKEILLDNKDRVEVYRSVYPKKQLHKFSNPNFQSKYQCHYDFV